MYFKKNLEISRFFLKNIYGSAPLQNWELFFKNIKSSMLPIFIMMIMSIIVNIGENKEFYKK